MIIIGIEKNPISKDCMFPKKNQKIVDLSLPLKNNFQKLRLLN